MFDTGYLVDDMITAVSNVLSISSVLNSVSTTSN